MTAEQVMMICDAIDQIGQTLFWCFLIICGGTVILTVLAFFLRLAIRRFIRYLWRRMAEGSL